MAAGPAAAAVRFLLLLLQLLDCGAVQRCVTCSATKLTSFNYYCCCCCCNSSLLLLLLLLPQVFPCGHYFCDHCASQQLNVPQPACAYCRQRVSKTSVFRSACSLLLLLPLLLLLLLLNELFLPGFAMPNVIITAHTID
jgi:hypothetical protein